MSNDTSSSTEVIYAVVHLWSRPDFLYLREAATVCKSEVQLFRGTARECRQYIKRLQTR
jgi:hypothetical protein